jgi:hypothetical protein
MQFGASETEADSLPRNLPQFVHKPLSMHD